MYKFNYIFITEVLVKGGVLDYIVFRGVSNILSFLFTYMNLWIYFNADQNNTTTNYDQKHVI